MDATGLHMQTFRPHILYVHDSNLIFWSQLRNRHNRQNSPRAIALRSRKKLEPRYGMFRSAATWVGPNYFSTEMYFHYQRISEIDERSTTTDRTTLMLRCSLNLWENGIKSITTFHETTGDFKFNPGTTYCLTYIVIIAISNQTHFAPPPLSFDLLTNLFAVCSEKIFFLLPKKFLGTF